MHNLARCQLNAHIYLFGLGILMMKKVLKLCHVFCELKWPCSVPVIEHQPYSPGRSSTQLPSKGLCLASLCWSAERQSQRIFSGQELVRVI